MKRKLVLLSLIIVHSVLLNASTLHAILISATDDTTIGKGAKRNHAFLKEQLQQVAEATTLDLKIKEITQNLTTSKIKQILEQLATKEDDVIVFYYSGHGINSNRNQWPAFLLPGRELALDQVYRQLKTKPHRLLLTIGDCCNIGGVLGNNPNYLAAKSKGILNAAGLSQLFEKESGNFLVSSSSPTQTSGYFDNIGGIYTSAFSDALRHALMVNDTKSWNWQSIFEETAIITKDMAGVFQKVQMPQLFREGIEPNKPNQKLVSQHPPKVYFIYKVKKGEGFYKIAFHIMKEARVDWHKNWKNQEIDFAKAIAKWNGLIINKSILKTNQELKINTLYLNELKATANKK